MIEYDMFYNMNVLSVFKFFIIRVTYSKYFDDIIEINTFHTTECQFYSFQHTNLCDFAFCFIDFKTRKKKKKKPNFFYDFCCRIYIFYEKVVSSAYAVYRKLWLNIFRSLVLFVLIKVKAISKTRMKRYAEIGSLCRVPHSSLK